ncbi:MAG TPA: thermonuclease family protein [Pyrinomonadaceae bacterium]|nr:thermonuclease family protein [Pyrinomonadaceae bacterium]
MFTSKPIITLLLVATSATYSQKVEGETATVIRAIDGDTLKVSIDGKYETVRLIGVNAPEMKDKRPQVQCFAKEAKAKADFLLSNFDVRLEADPSQADRDKYGRLLRYVFLKDDLFNKWIIAKGYAYEYTFDRPV